MSGMKKLKTYRLRFLIMLAVLAVVAVGYFMAGGIGNFCCIVPFPRTRLFPDRYRRLS